MFRPTMHTLKEMAKLLRDGESVSDLPEERDRLASLLEELERTRAAIYEARVALAKSDKNWPH